MIKQLAEQEFGAPAVAAATFCGLVCPGFVAFLLYLPAWVEAFDVLKLTIAAVSVTLPFAAFSFVAVVPHLRRKFPGSNMRGIWMLTTACSSLAWYAALYLAYLRTLSFQEFSVTVIGLHVVGWALLYFVVKGNGADAYYARQADEEESA